MKLWLHRLYLDEATLGVLELEDGRRFWTLEDTWKGNGPDSCVPEGRYMLERHAGARWKNTWALVGGSVAHWPTEGYARSAVLIHAGNDTDDTRGCVLVGMKAEITGLRAPEVYASGVAFNALLQALAGESTHELVIQRG